MKAEGIRELRKGLNHLSKLQLIEICLRLSKFKKENKELLTYLLFEAEDEETYIKSIKTEIDLQFNEINTSSYYYIKKSIRKILRNTKKFIRYSGKKDTQVELLIYFCQKMQFFSPSIHRNKTLQNLYERQLMLIKKTVSNMHPDLQYDYKRELEELRIEN